MKKIALFLDKKGYLQPGASSGNISIRNPNNPNEMIITLSGESLDDLKEGTQSFCRVSLSLKEHTTKSVDWSKWNFSKNSFLGVSALKILNSGSSFTINSAPLIHKQKRASFETWMHWAILKHIANANAVVHMHSPNSTTFASLNPEFIRQIIDAGNASFPNGETTNVVPYINIARVVKCGPIVWCPDFPAASNELHEAIWRVLSANKAIALILQNHGLITIGETARVAATVAAEVEQEIGIVLDSIRINKGKPDGYNFFPREVVIWSRENIAKSCPWEKVYGVK